MMYNKNLSMEELELMLMEKDNKNEGLVAPNYIILYDSDFEEVWSSFVPELIRLSVEKATLDIVDWNNYYSRLTEYSGSEYLTVEETNLMHDRLKETAERYDNKSTILFGIDNVNIIEWVTDKLERNRNMAINLINSYCPSAWSIQQETIREWVRMKNIEEYDKERQSIIDTYGIDTIPVLYNGGDIRHGSSRSNKVGYRLDRKFKKKKARRKRYTRKGRR